MTTQNGPEPVIVIPEYEKPGKDRSVGVRRKTYEKLREIKRRTGQSYAAIIEMLVERAK